MADGLAWDDLTPALEDPGVGIRRMDGAWGTLPEQPPRHQQKPRRSGAFAQWWGQDSNLRRLSQRVYSPSPLTAREPHRGGAESSVVPRVETGSTQAPMTAGGADRDAAGMHIKLMGGLRRAGTFVLDLKTTLITLIGGMDLDLTQADVPDGATITKVSLIGGVSLTVPPGTGVDA